MAAHQILAASALLAAAALACSSSSGGGSDAFTPTNDTTTASSAGSIPPADNDGLLRLTPPDGYSQRQTDLFTIEVHPAVIDAGFVRHEAMTGDLLELAAAWCDMAAIDPDSSGPVAQAAQQEFRDDLTGIAEINGIPNPAETVNRLIDTVARAAGQHLCPGHAEWFTTES